MQYYRFFLQIFIFPILLSLHLFAADMQPISFVDSRDPVPSNGIVNYEVAFKNNVPTEAINPELNVSVPAGFTFVGVSDPGVDCNYTGATPSAGLTDKVHCTGATFPGSTSFDIAITLRAPIVATPTVFTSIATVTSDIEINTDNDSEIVRTTVVQGVDLNLSKTSTPNPITAADTVTYKFEVGNQGPHDAINIKMTDELPSGLTFVADNNATLADDDALWSCTAVGQVVTCIGGTLDNNMTQIFYFRAKVTGFVGDISNAATVSSDITEIDPNDNTDTDVLVVNAGTDMAIIKSVLTNPVISEQNVSFSLEVTNNGPVVAEDVNITDFLPLGYSNIIASATGWTCAVEGVRVDCNRSISPMPVGLSETISIIAQVPEVNSSAVHQNTAVVRTSTEDVITSNDTDTVNYIVNIDQSDLRLTKAKSPAILAVGGIASSVIRVENLGPRVATPVQVVDALDISEIYVGYSGTDWNCTHDASVSGGIVVCDYNQSLSLGEITSFLVIESSAGTEANLSNTACTGGSSAGGISSLEPLAIDKNPSNDCATASVIATDEQGNGGSGTADIRVLKSSDDTSIDPSENSFNYQINVKNLGVDTSRQVEFRDNIPQYVSAFGGRPATTLVATTDKLGAVCTVSASLVICQLGDMLINDEVNINILLSRPMADGNLTNIASAYSPLTGDNNLSNNEDNTSVNVLPVADIELQSKIVTPSAVLAGTEATYTIQIRNNGPSTAEDVNISDIFTGNPFTFISASTTSGSCATFDTGTQTLSCSMGNIASGVTHSVVVVIRPDHLVPTPAGSWEINNTASVSMTTLDSNASNNAKTETLTVSEGKVDLLIEKQESPDFFEPVFYDPLDISTNFIVYEIQLQNLGPSLATDVNYTDRVYSVAPALGQKLYFVGDTNNSDGTGAGLNECTMAALDRNFTVGPSAPTVNCHLDELEVGVIHVRYLVFHIENDPNLVSGDVYRDEINVTSREIETLFANNVEDERTTVRVSTDPQIIKTGPLAPVEVGENFNFILTVSNNGPGYSPETTVTDNLPADMVLTATPTASPQGVCTGTVGGTSFTCNVDDVDGTLHDIGSGDTYEVNITMPVKMIAYPAGGTVTNTARVSTSGPDSNLSNNEDNATVIVLQPAHIGDRVWDDLNADGVQDAGEPGIPNVSVFLIHDANGSIAQTSITNASGLYGFDVNHSASYGIRFVPPSNYIITVENNTSTTDTQDSDINASAEIASEFLDYGEDNRSLDAGFFKVASIGDKVWIDYNGDGIQDNNADEIGVSAVNVKLYNSSNVQITKDINGTQFGSDGSIDSNSSGEYLFDNLRPGAYYLSFDKDTLPAGGYIFALKGGGLGTPDASDSDVNATGVTDVTNLQSAEDDYSWDAGIYIPARLGDRVWFDRDANGIQDTNEGNISDLNVSLYNTSNTLVSQTQTDINGNYAFSALRPRDYYVEFALTDNSNQEYASSTQVGLQDDANNSDANATGQTQTITLVSASNNPNIDAGLYIPVSLGDYVWSDANGNGFQDSTENGIANARVTLYRVEDNGSISNIAIQDTNASGGYLFESLKPDNYYVEFTQPDHFRTTLHNNSLDDSKDSDANRSTGRSSIVTLISPDDNISIDAGFYELGVISGDVSADTDNDDIGDFKLQDVNITLLDVNGVFVALASTDINGEYIFIDIEPGIYTLVQTQPDTYASLSENEGGEDNDTGNTTLDNIISVQLNIGEIDIRNDFVEERSVSIGDRVWIDDNGDGIQDANESDVTDLAGIEIYLRESGNIVASTVTDVNGSYLFAGFLEGDYSVEFNLSTLPIHFGASPSDQGSDDSIDSDANDSTGLTGSDHLFPAENNTSFDLGIYALGTISGTIWIDVNDDGIGDIPLAGVTLILIDDQGNEVARTLTQADGTYLFIDVPQGTYSIIEEQPYGFFDVSETNGDYPADGILNAIKVDVGPGENDIDNDFIEEQAAVLGDFVWYDDNLDGIQNIAEEGVEGIRVYLLDDNADRIVQGGTFVFSDTNASGGYIFDFLRANNDYAIELDFSTVPKYYELTEQDLGLDEDKDSDIDLNTGKTETVALTVGQFYKDLDIGIILGIAHIGDYFWIDANANGIQDANENPIEGARIELFDANGDPINDEEGNHFVITDENGQYGFFVLPGTYQVKFNIPSTGYMGYEFSVENQGDNDSLDTDANQQGFTQTLTLTRGDNILTLDAGINCGCQDVSTDSASTLGIWGMFLLLFTVFGITLLLLKQEENIYRKKDIYES